MLNRPSATHPSQTFLRIHPCSKTRLGSVCLCLDLEQTWLGLSVRLLKTIWLIFWLFYTSCKVKKEKTTSIAEKFVKTNAIFSAILRFANTQSRRISAVTHIKILSAEHAQTKCPYAIVQQIARKKTKTLAPVFVQFSTLILIIISIRAVFLRIWRHFLQFSTKNWNKGN